MNKDLRTKILAILSKTESVEDMIFDQETIQQIDEVVTLIKGKNNLEKSKKQSLNKDEVLEKPPVSEAQRRAMYAAAAGKSNIGIPASVGKEFTDADQGGKLPEHVKKEEIKFAKNRQWSLEKVAAPGPTIKYQSQERPKRTPEQNAALEAKAGTLKYTSRMEDPKYIPPADAAPKAPKAP